MVLKILIPALVTLVFLFLSAVSLANEGNLNSNVKFPSGLLNKSDTDKIDSTLNKLRDAYGIEGGLLIVDSLAGEPVSKLAARTYETWYSEDSKKNYGLLLILAMKDRESHFEIGVKLRNKISNADAKKALDVVLRPLIRKGNIAEAVSSSFLYLAEPKIYFEEPKTTTSLKSKNYFDYKRGIVAIFFILSSFLFLGPISKKHALNLAKQLEMDYKDYKIENDLYFSFIFQPVLFNGKYLTYEKEYKARFSKKVFKYFGTFFACVQGFAISGMHLYAMYSVLVLIVIFCAIYYFSILSKYRSKDNFIKYLNKLRQINSEYLTRGYLVETKLGQFEFTEAYFKSQDFQIKFLNKRLNKYNQHSRGSSYNSETSSDSDNNSSRGSATSNW